MVKCEENLVTLELNVSTYDTSSDRGFDLMMEIEDVLREMVMLNNCGKMDGHEFAISEYDETITYFIYGKDVEKIKEAIAPILEYLPSKMSPKITEGFVRK